MNIQIFGTKKCKETQKALRFFKERGIQPHLVDLKEKGISPGEFDAVARRHSAQDLIDEGSPLFKKKGLAYMDYDPREEVLENPLLLKTPVVRRGQDSTIGYQPDHWKSWI